MSLASVVVVLINRNGNRPCTHTLTNIHGTVHRSSGISLGGGVPLVHILHTFASPHRAEAVLCSEVSSGAVAVGGGNVATSIRHILVLPF